MIHARFCAGRETLAEYGFEFRVFCRGDNLQPEVSVFSYLLAALKRFFLSTNGGRAGLLEQTHPA